MRDLWSECGLDEAIEILNKIKAVRQVLTCITDVKEDMRGDREACIRMLDKYFEDILFECKKHKDW